MSDKARLPYVGVEDANSAPEPLPWRRPAAGPLPGRVSGLPAVPPAAAGSSDSVWPAPESAAPGQPDPLWPVPAAPVPPAPAAGSPSFIVGWSVYVGWNPYYYMAKSGILKKWAAKYDVDIRVQRFDYAPSLDAFVAKNIDACAMTNM